MAMVANVHYCTFINNLGLEVIFHNVYNTHQNTLYSVYCKFN